MSSQKGLTPESMERTLFALKEVATLLEIEGVERCRAVATEALRRAANGPQFIEEVLHHTGLRLEMIEGVEEATLSCKGVLAAIEPTPEQCLIFDIGGGSTEFVLWRKGEVLFRASYPLGVVRLCEDFPSAILQRRRIDTIINHLFADFQASGIKDLVMREDCPLVGTAGTVTTLAAVHLSLTQYDWRKVNNHRLARLTLETMLNDLKHLSPHQREKIPGIETGRGDLIVPGLQAVLAFMKSLGRNDLVVSDFGLLEGALLDISESIHAG